MNKGFIARASTSIHAPLDKVWKALVDPHAIKQYMFGTNVVTGLARRESDYLERGVAGQIL
jgi:uncharacterized protein YndB with AHSA1/START domain